MVWRLPRILQLALETMYPDVTLCFGLAGSADQNPCRGEPLNWRNITTTGSAKVVDSVLRGRMVPVDGQLVACYKEIEGKTQAPITQEKLKELFATGNQYERPYAQYLLKQLNDKDTLPTSYPYPIQTWHLGDSDGLFRWRSGC